jgi:hypothetical protein
MVRVVTINILIQFLIRQKTKCFIKIKIKIKIKKCGGGSVVKVWCVGGVVVRVVKGVVKGVCLYV